MDLTEQQPSSSIGGGDIDQPDHRSRIHRGAYIAIAVGSALLSAAATTTVLWLTGTFDREVVRITEIVEVTKVVGAPVQDTPSALPGDTSTSTLIEALPAAPDTEVEPIVPSFTPTDLVATVAARAVPSIVTVQSFDEDLVPAGSGSGVIIRSNGYLVTNNHVIDGAETLRVIMSDGFSYPAKLVGADPLMDIAVLKVETLGLTAIEFGSMEGAKTGDPAIAVGNPLGLDGGPSVTAGVISAFDRTLTVDFRTGDTLYGLLQTDAPITRGSSGGALLDVQGRLIGITTAIGLSDVGAEGLGFAVPINLVEGIVNDLMTEGGVSHAFLGIRGSSAFTEWEDGVESPLGVEISLLDDSAIGAAGAQDGDVIVALDGEQVRSMPLLVARLRSYRAGDPVTVTVDRGDEIVDIDMVLDMYPS